VTSILFVSVMKLQAKRGRRDGDEAFSDDSGMMQVATGAVGIDGSNKKRGYLC
jgi:hypothetical protein